jgi:hypothetical protein
MFYTQESYFTKTIVFMKFLKSKRSRRILLLAGLLLLGVGAYVGYELYAFNKAMDTFGEAMAVFTNLAEIFTSFDKTLPDSTGAIDSTIMIDSTRTVVDSLITQ